MSNVLYPPADLDEALSKLKADLIAELSPPWWEKWALVISFFLGVVVGMLIYEPIWGRLL
jgi:hypothetical protein